MREHIYNEFPWISISPMSLTEMYWGPTCTKTCIFKTKWQVQDVTSSSTWLGRRVTSQQQSSGHSQFVPEEPCVLS